jgi:hypothetical protein
VEGRKRSWPNIKVLYRNLPGGIEETIKHISEDSRFPCRDLNSGPPTKQECRPRSSVNIPTYQMR